MHVVVRMIKSLNNTKPILIADFVGPADINNYGGHQNFRLNPERHRNASDEDLKYILFWNEAYGSKVHFIGIVLFVILSHNFRSMTWALEDSHSMTISVRRLDALLQMTGAQVELLRYTEITNLITRSLKPIDQFEAIFFHQRSLDFNDVPTIRNVCAEKMNLA